MRFCSKSITTPTPTPTTHTTTLVNVLNNLFRSCTSTDWRTGSRLCQVLSWCRPSTRWTSAGPSSSSGSLRTWNEARNSSRFHSLFTRILIHLNHFVNPYCPLLSILLFNYDFYVLQVCNLFKLAIAEQEIIWNSSQSDHWNSHNLLFNFLIQICSVFTF